MWELQGRPHPQLLGSNFTQALETIKSKSMEYLMKGFLMKHTPGPWVIKHEFNVYAGNRSVAACGGYSQNFDHEKVHAENVANAHLVSAAPDLLEVCQEIEEWFSSEAAMDYSSYYPPWWGRLGKALDKAEGVNEQQRENTEMKHTSQGNAKEFNDNFQPSRRKWRTLVRIASVDPEKNLFYVVVPGWGPQQVIQLRLQDLPENIRKLVIEEQITRLHAKVNLGAEASEGLYFEDWEFFDARN